MNVSVCWYLLEIVSPMVINHDLWIISMGGISICDSRVVSMLPACKRCHIRESQKKVGVLWNRYMFPL